MTRPGQQPGPGRHLSSLPASRAPPGKAASGGSSRIGWPQLCLAAGQRRQADTGEPGLTVARLAPRGHLVPTDLAAEMLGIATRRANAQGITNFETKVCSADDLPFGDAAFGSISVRFGYMFFPDVAKATAEFARVLKPGGRLCSSVWVKPGENPWTTIAMQAVAAEAVLAPPDPDGPDMFRCAA